MLFAGAALAAKFVLIVPARTSPVRVVAQSLCATVFRIFPHKIEVYFVSTCCLFAHAFLMYVFFGVGVLLSE